MSVSSKETQFKKRCDRCTGLFRTSCLREGTKDVKFTVPVFTCKKCGNTFFSDIMDYLCKRAYNWPTIDEHKFNLLREDCVVNDDKDYSKD